MKDLNKLKQEAKELQAKLENLANLLKDHLISQQDYYNQYGKLNIELKVVNWYIDSLSKAN